MASALHDAHLGTADLNPPCLPRCRDGTPSFIVPLTIVFLLILGITVYISLDTAFGISSVFLLENGSQQLQNLKNVALFVLGLVWPLL